ncbi:protein RCC2-like [Hordeum vulgare subsp. vulgare]|uniref:protein RCC2-like n=1 Tax=Hordeum vulgare subsp. vulgare TaxID=112509 RepID=UPI001D1A376D|nr:protein RCC2-like [Hordeum vulgare subsp. vulgare]
MAISRNANTAKGRFSPPLSVLVFVLLHGKGHHQNLLAKGGASPAVVDWRIQGIWCSGSAEEGRGGPAGFRSESRRGYHPARKARGRRRRRGQGAVVLRHAACHYVALNSDGRCFSWGRNEKGQLGHGDTLLRNLPTVVSKLSKYNIIAAGVGRNHTVVVTDEGESFAFGDNKHGQLGMGSLRSGFTLQELRCQPVPSLVTKATNAICGANFNVWLSSVEGSSILTTGLPQYGQLGHGSDNEYIANVSSVRLAYDPQPNPRAIVALSGKTVVKVACGTNHTVAVDSSGFVYTSGFGGYGRLGHNEQKDEWQPRPVEIFQKNNILSPSDIISAGSASSACTASRGQLYMWGKLNNWGDECMYPKPVRDLSGWNIRCMASGSMHHIVCAHDSCISWGLSEYGEFGYGPT